MNTPHLDSINLISANLLRDDYPNALYAFDYALRFTLQRSGVSTENIKKGRIDPPVFWKALAETRASYKVKTFRDYIFENEAGWATTEQAAREASALQEIEARPETIEALDACVRILNESHNLKEIDLAYTRALKLCDPTRELYLLGRLPREGLPPEICAFREETPTKPGMLRKPSWSLPERKS